MDEKNKKREILFGYLLGNLKTDECLQQLQAIDDSFQGTPEEVERILFLPPITRSTPVLVVDNG
jgi:hypothetical protein